MVLPTLVVTWFTMFGGDCSAQANCGLSMLSQPNGVVGLQLIYADDQRSWAWADDLHVNWLRIELRWDWIESKQGQFDPSYVDKVISLANAHHQKIMVLFNHVPRWAQKDPGLLPARAAKALVWLVVRHGARVSAWEIFNEPNLPGHGWPSIGNSVQESAILYSKTLAAASNAIRTRDKQAFIVSAGLSPQNDPENYARWVIRLTPPACYDAFGLHPYGENGRFAVVQRNAAILQEQEHQAIKPVWFTEYGTDRNDKSSEVIASLLVEKSKVPITFYFAERDLGGFFAEQYGLRNFDGSTKSAYDLFKQLTNP